MSVDISTTHDDRVMLDLSITLHVTNESVSQENALTDKKLCRLF